MIRVHPTAVVAEGAEIGDGTAVWHFCHVMRGARIGEGVVIGQNGFIAGRVIIGDRCRIQNNVSLYDGVELERDVFVGPSAVFTNVRRPRAAFPRKDGFERTLVQEGATIGANATVLCGVVVGRCAMVGAGAVVTRNVGAHALVVGAPAAFLGWVCRCGERLDETEMRCLTCGRAYETTEDGLRECR